jgi:hypothetical protein
MSAFSQIDEHLRRDSLRPIAVIALEPEELTERYGLIFEPDGRRAGVAAMIETAGGDQYMLLRHDDDPCPGTEVLASELSIEPGRDLTELLGALNLDANLVTWKLDEMDARASERERLDRVRATKRKRLDLRRLRLRLRRQTGG